MMGHKKPHPLTVIYSEHNQNGLFNIEAGVPQGEILSPALYNIYLHDLPPPPEHTKNIVYVDDISQIITSTRNPWYHNNRFIEQIHQIHNFEKEWKIQMNINKFSIVHLDNKRPPVVYVENKKTEAKSKGNILGLTIRKTGST